MLNRLPWLSTQVSLPRTVVLSTFSKCAAGQEKISDAFIMWYLSTKKCLMGCYIVLATNPTAFATNLQLDLPNTTNQRQFQSCQVTRAGDTRSTEPLCHSWISTRSNIHNWPEFYPGNAWVCPALELPMQLTHYFRPCWRQECERSGAEMVLLKTGSPTHATRLVLVELTFWTLPIILGN